MIKIISGTYGYKSPNGIYIAKSNNDEPFSLSKEEEERLVSQGIAKFIEVKAINEDEAKDYFSMTRPELDEIASALDIDYTKIKTKKELIELIQDAQKVDVKASGETEDEEEVTEKLVFDVADGIVDGD